MYPGLLLIGSPDLDGDHFELINNDRAFANAALAGLCWLQDDDDTFTCEVAPQVVSGVLTYEGAPIFSSPWFNTNDPDTQEFMGVIGIDVTGANSSTRTATVTPALTGGGVVGPLYYQPRTLVVRAIAIATSMCGLESGLNWMRFQSKLVTDECGGDTLTFFDCCPCACDPVDVDVTSNECWINSFEELVSGPSCTVDFWPSTFAELRDGPAEGESETWCTWITNLRQLADDGPPDWACCAESCVIPYMRQLHNVRVIQGPIVVNQRPMNSNGVMAQIEFTIVAADPSEYTLPETALVVTHTEGIETVIDPPDPPDPDPDDPFDIGPVIKRPDLIPATIDPGIPPQTWNRETYVLDISDDQARLGMTVFQITVTAIGVASGQVRIGVWSEDRVAGYYVPSLPAGSPVTFDGKTRRVTTPGPDGPRVIDAFARGYDGGPLVWDDALEYQWVHPEAVISPGGYTLTIDRDVGDDSPIAVRVTAASMAVA